MHAVTPVTASDNPRLSIFGWFYIPQNEFKMLNRHYLKGGLWGGGGGGGGKKKGKKGKKGKGGGGGGGGVWLK